MDADYFTRKFYEENFGITFQTSDRYKNTLDSSKDEPLRPIEIPPHNGFGSEEDSLGSVLHLVPKVVFGFGLRWVLAGSVAHTAPGPEARLFQADRE